MDPFDLDRLRDIPDPYAAAAEKPVRAPAPTAMPASPTRAGMRSARIGALAAALVYQALWLAFVKHRDDLGVTPLVELAVAFGIPFVATVLATAGVVRGGRLGLGQSVPRLVTLVGASVAVFFVGTLLSAPADTDGPRLVSHALQCMGITCGLAAAPIALGAWAFRRSFAVSSPWRGASLGAAAGALSATTMSLLCSTGGVGHVLFGHGVMIVVGAIAGAVFGEKIMRA